MPQAAKPIPEGYHSLTPYLVIRDAAKAIDFYKRALGASELYRMKSPDGKLVMHADLKIGDSHFMLSDEMPQHGPTEHKEGHVCQSVQTLKGSPVGFYIYVTDVDQSFKKALDAGGKQYETVADMFWGDRVGSFTDPFGFQWSIATRKEDLKANEIDERAKAFFAKKKVA